MIKLKDIPYPGCFYWKGEKYKQFIRPKKPKGKFHIACIKTKDLCGDKIIYMPSNRKVKEILRVNNASS